MEDGKTYTALALAGTIPFVACSLLLLFGIASVPYLGALDEVVASYGLAIVCFLAGTHWGVYLANRPAISLNLFVVSNVVFLAAWFAYLGNRVDAAIFVQLLAFAALLIVDRRLETAGVVTATYFRVRLWATLVAGVSLILVLAQ